MKTNGLRRLFLVTFILVGLSSCKDEEFYEKEFIDTLSEQYEEENLPDDVAEQEWDNPDNNPDLESYVPPTDGQVVGSTLPTDDYTPPTDDVANDDTAPVDNSTPPTDDYTPPTDDVANDDTPPVDNTPPTDDYTPPTSDTPAVDTVVTSDSFTQSGSGSKLDILWVVDNSGSMGDEQKALGENFDAFIKDFVTKDIDFKMAVTTTDTSRNNAGRAYKNSMELLNSNNLKADKSKFMEDFKAMVKVGTNGSGYERGIKASESFSQRYNDNGPGMGANNWVRDDAYFIIVYMSDEEDQSKKSVPAHLKQIQKWKNNNGLIKAFSIVDMVPNRKRGAISRGYERYKEISDLTGGEVASIKGDFHATLLNMGEVIAKLTEQFPLSQKPYDPSAIKVYVDGIQVSEWSYNSTSNSITFNPDALPAASAVLKVEYGVAK